MSTQRVSRVPYSEQGIQGHWCFFHFERMFKTSCHCFVTNINSTESWKLALIEASGESVKMMVIYYRTLVGFPSVNREYREACALRCCQALHNPYRVWG